MQYTLKDYQEDAVADVLGNLADARDDWHRRSRPVAFSLTATTGAGKTVMAAAVIEALFDGNDDLDFQADPGAVVLWFTDDPSLNEQTRFRLMDASDQIAHSRLEVIGDEANDLPAHVVEALGRPRNHVKRVGAQHRLRRRTARPDRPRPVRPTRPPATRFTRCSRGTSACGGRATPAA